MYSTLLSGCRASTSSTTPDFLRAVRFLARLEAWGAYAGERKALLVEILLEQRWERTADLWGALAQASNLSATENRPALFEPCVLRLFPVVRRSKREEEEPIQPESVCQRMSISSSEHVP